MSFKIALLSILGLFVCTAGTQAAVKPGDTVIQMNFENAADRDKWPLKPFAAWVKEGPDGGMALKVTVPANEAP